MTPRICETVTAATMRELRVQRDAAVDADLVELRLDTVRDPDVAGALQGRRKPVLITCRARSEGGAFAGSEDERRRILLDAVEQGAEYVDVEWRAGFTDVIAVRQGKGIVLSTHDFDGLPADLIARAHAMSATGAEIVKIAAKVARLDDCVMLKAAGEAAREPGRRIVIGMGDAGLVTRVLPHRFASAWTYTGALAGIGQITTTSLLEDFGFRGCSATTDLYGVVGSPVSHSISPAMHNAAMRAVGIDAVYLPLPAADADDFMRFAAAFGLRGASVTIPFKVALAARLDAIDETARGAGAVNTIRMSNGRAEGTNTDVAGFLAPLGREGVTLRGARVSVLGAGGAARAVVVGLAREGALVRVHARDAARAEPVANLASGTVGPWPPAPGTWDVLVNTTPIGMHPVTDASPLPADLLTGRVVYDLVYNPETTRLLREAAAAGCQTIGGLDMLVAQADEQFQYWTGRVAPPDVMRGAATRRLSEFAR